MANSLDDVIDQMRSVGISPPDDLKPALSKYLRWRPDCERAKAKKSAWARLFEWQSPKSNRIYITGTFGWRGDQYTVEASTKDWSPEERAAELEARKAAEKAAKDEREADAAKAAAKAKQMWDRSRDSEHGPLHPYLERKKVGAFGVRVGFNNRLLIPLRDIENNLAGLQYISPEGEKIFGTGTAKEGKFHLIGEVTDVEPICFAEGYATAASGHMATGWPVVVCYDAGNIEPVVAQWRKLYPDHRFVILADDDRHLLQRLVDRLADLGIHATAAELAKLGEHEWELPDHKVVLKAGWSKDQNGVAFVNGHIVVDGNPRPCKLENAGWAKAAAAVRKHKCLAIRPSFANKESKRTDWIDLHLAEGLELVRNQIKSALEDANDAKKKTRATDAPQGGGKDEPGPDMGFLERFTLIYGTTTVWDEKERAIIRLESMKVAFGKSVDWWLGSPDRRMVSQANVIFDPTGKIAQPGTHVNLFDRLPLDPKPGDCELIIKHLYNLCGEDDKLFHWVCCWLALPLQKRGTKMRTSLIIHGRMEGTGKSLMMDIMRRIYGRYSRSITQTQLQSEFNGWQSGMLFCVAEEVVSASERKNLKNLIQNMITNEVIQVNEKNMPVREEASYANFVFLSNEQLPMLLNETDRRYTVIQVENRHELEYFQALGACMESGGIEAFYDWLLNYDVGDVTPYTLPFETAARRKLIGLGQTADQRFMTEWAAGLTSLPFCTTTARELYRAFQCWCRINGERFVCAQKQFGVTASEALERMGAPPKVKKRFDAFTADQVERDELSMTEAQQSILYLVPARMQRITPGGPVATEEQAAESWEEAEVYNKRIRQFQHALAKLISQARRVY